MQQVHPIKRETEARGRATAAAAARLRDGIVLGELPPGSRIPEREICERLGLSRTPLREALKILEADGLVIIEPNRGAVVVDLSATDVTAALEVLAALEGTAAELACERASDEEIEAIGDLHEKMVAHHRAGALLDYFHVNQAIHQAIVDAAGNPVLSRVYRAESGRIRRYRYASNLADVRWDEAVREHEHIIEALRARRGALLREITRVHLLAGWRAMLSRETEEAGDVRTRRRKA